MLVNKVSVQSKLSTDFENKLYEDLSLLKLTFM